MAAVYSLPGLGTASVKAKTEAKPIPKESKTIGNDDVINVDYQNKKMKFKLLGTSFFFDWKQKEFGFKKDDEKK